MIYASIKNFVSIKCLINLNIVKQNAPFLSISLKAVLFDFLIYLKQWFSTLMLPLQYSSSRPPTIALFLLLNVA